MFAALLILLSMLAITWFASIPKSRTERLAGILSVVVVFVVIVLVWPTMISEACSTVLKFVEHK